MTMTMNMRIIMTMNIYIKPELEDRLRKEPTMSGLINNLLERHYFDTVGEKTQAEVLADIKKAQASLRAGGAENAFTFVEPVPSGRVQVVPVAEKFMGPDRYANGVCKKHGTALDSRGKCLQKGH